ncbi:hypothetical protein KI387_042946, partial [Taxus chinensis]
MTEVLLHTCGLVLMMPDSLEVLSDGTKRIDKLPSPFTLNSISRLVALQATLQVGRVWKSGSVQQ